MGLLLPFDHAERELNAKLKPQLHSIHASLKLNKEVTASNVAILKTLLDDICNQMKQKDALFDLLFNRLVYTGSYYDGLRTKKADEFDINLVLSLPFEKDEITVLDGCPGYVCYKVSPTALHRLLRKGDVKWVPFLLKWLDIEKRLLPDRVKRWLQSVFDRFLQTYIVPSGSCSAVDKIQPSQHGPAKTFYIILKNGLQIDVDLVPVIEFCYPSWPKGIQKKGWMANMFSKDCNWFLIPKPPTPNSHLWRLHFPNMEKKLIKDYGCVKPIIRLLKVLDHLGHALVQPGPAIPYLFHPELDLVETVTRVTRDNIGGRIKRIVRKLRLFPDQCCELVLKDQWKGQAPSDNVVGDVVSDDFRNVASNNVVRDVLSNDVVEVETNDVEDAALSDEAPLTQSSGRAWKCCVIL